MTQSVDKEALEVLDEWQAEDHELRIITVDDDDVGFVHIWFKRPIVTWIEDLWVDEERCGHGIASAAIGAVEDWMRQEFPDVEAVSMNVAPRNKNALRLYHRLGYDAVSMITLCARRTPESSRTRPGLIFWVIATGTSRDDAMMAAPEGAAIAVQG